MPTHPSTSPPTGALPDTAALTQAASASAFEVLRTLDTGPHGLTEAEAARRQDTHGENTVDLEPATAPLAATWAALRSPFVALLSGLAVVFAAVGDVRGAVTVAVMVLASVALRRWQQVRSDRAVRAVGARLVTTVTVRRRADDDADPCPREVPLSDVVPGDVVLLGPGDVVPADLRLVTGADLFVDQAVLTGETLPVAKSATGACDGGPEDAAVLCLAGSEVVAGTATAVVVAVGGATYSGALARRAGRERPESSFDRGVRGVSRTLVRFMLVLVPIVFAVNGTVTGDWEQALLFATAVAVGLTPEMLPVVVTTALARGARRLARAHVIVTRLNAVQDLGAADVVCLDKTGTLTEERLVATHSLDPWGRPDDEAAAYAVLAVRSQIAPAGRLDEAVLDQLADPTDPLDDAVYSPEDEIGFDQVRRRASVVVRRQDGERLMITKGDPDEVLPRCSQARVEGDAVELDAGRRFAAHDLARAHADQGLRLLAVAAKRLPRLGAVDEADEQDLTLVGFVGFVDPVRESAPATVRGLAEHGVEVLLLTGDNRHVAARVAHQAGIPASEVVVGEDLDALDDVRLARLLERARVFARVTPAHKVRVVTALRGAGRVVGFVGDGVNDAPALRIADVGIAPDSATPAAKRAADLVLTDPDLAVLAAGVVEGRRTLGNTLKYVTITASSNFGNVLALVAAAVLLPFLPMLPLQLVVQNLLYDAAQLALPWDRVDPEYTARPRRWDTSELVRFMLTFGPLSSLFDLATFGVLWWGLDASGAPAQFRAGWFVEGLLTQLAIVLVLRTRGAPWRRLPRRPVVLAALAVAVTGLGLSFGPLAGALSMQNPPPVYLLWITVAVLGYAGLAQALKAVHLRRRGRWL
ncbi:magnesium-translocating P-type ATPase [Actinomycetospora corticicola]|uniref:Magnesium-transporting ATPase, P-type 1 n=1 Tax=Actinomycetospora corticicola TaxID=663602 RepID=A0A7Y9E0D6_9PSEU|nr:magnesium-translocating P-type ATPase [Actinomycetospora corticicola]NYD38757.1 Mg2+-importing ATPase [Actinomycetospora corticicola]